MTAGELSRRQFVGRAALVAGGAAVAGMAGGLAVAPASGATAETAAYTPVALTSGELTTLQAVLARLLPADELGPGAVEAGVQVYIDRELAHSYAPLLPAYRQSLAFLDKSAQKLGAASFAALSPQQQDTLLKQVEAGELAHLAPASGSTQGAGVTPTQFFQILLQHMREGMFGDPMYGGNHNFAGWDLIGFAGIKLVWTAEEQAIGAVVAPAHASDAQYGGHPVL
jgi:gluconate 2-dehydrogenase gamma chain